MSLSAPGLLFIFNAVAPEERRGAFADCAAWPTIRALRTSLARTGYRVYSLNLKSTHQLERLLDRLPRPEIAFVIAEGFLDQPVTLYSGSGPALVRRILQRYAIPFTHSSPLAMRRCRYKHCTYRVLACSGLPVPSHHLVLPGRPDWPQRLATAAGSLNFPLFVKPNGGGNGMGISQDSIVSNLSELLAQVQRLSRELGPVPILVENYLPGREYTVGLLGHGPTSVLPVLAFPPDGQVRDQERKQRQQKNKEGLEVFTSNDPRYSVFRRLANQAFAAVGAQDVLRLDVREDREGVIRVIDVNGTPSLANDASLPYMAAMAGLNRDDLVYLVIEAALRRNNAEPPPGLIARTSESLRLLAPYIREDIV